MLNQFISNHKTRQTNTKTELWNCKYSENSSFGFNEFEPKVTQIIGNISLPVGPFCFFFNSNRELLRQWSLEQTPLLVSFSNQKTYNISIL